jgi:protoporphyrin/coproporphyrin ferrochelatase
MRKGILLINLGTPDSYDPKDVKKYLIEFLTDERVIDIPKVKRNLLVRSIIIPLRYRTSAKYYRTIWTSRGSPLLYHTQNLRNGVQSFLGAEYQVEFAMRYQTPSIAQALEKLKNVQELLIFPLFPQYASATTGSIYQKVMEQLANWQTHPTITFINQFCEHEAFLDAFAEQIEQFSLDDYDRILFSCHGLPERQLRKCDPHGRCLEPGCCKHLHDKNSHCYSAQCHATTRALAEKLEIDNYSISFQSRLGRDPWIKPYTSDVLKELAEKGAKKILVICPSFVADCLETLHEISIEYLAEFQKLGGETLDLVPSLNSTPKWIQAVSQISEEHFAQRSEQVLAALDEHK